MSNERPSDHTRIRKITGSFKGKLSSFLHLSRAPTPSSIGMDPSSDNSTNVLPPNMIPVVGANRAPSTAFATTEASNVPPSILAPVSSLILAAPKQLGSTPGPGTSRTHMSMGSRSPLSTSSPDSVMQAPTGLERSPSARDSGSGLFPNAQNILINGGTFIGSVRPDKGQMKTSVSRKPNSSSLFTGRKDVLDKLGKIFVHGSDSKLKSRHSCLLWGTGGIGKTQICLKFIEEISDRLSHVFWVDASSLESINMSLIGISSIPAAQASCPDGSAESALQWISGIQEEWLIVFDNADDLPPAVVDKFIPPGNRGNILITSRNRSMGRLTAFENVIEINEMEEADAITLLLKASCLDASAEHLHAAKDIVASLGCMPLAVDQAGSYIEVRKCGINEYLRQFSSHRLTLMSDATFRGASDYDRTVYGTWDLSFKEIKERASGQSHGGNAQAAKAAILILGICAFYHHSNISDDIFQSAAEQSGKYVVDRKLAKKLPHAVNSLDHTLLALHNDGHWDDFIYKQGVGVLLSFSLIKRDQSLKMLSVHPLIHCWSREQMSKTEQQRMYEIGTIILSCAISQRVTGYDFELRQMIFPHIKANELHGSEMGLTKQYYDDKCNNFRYVMEEIGYWNNAEQLAKQVFYMRKKLLGAKHPGTLTSMGDLARTYRHQGKLNEAEQLEVQVFYMRKKLLGPEHPDTLLTMGNLATTYGYQGKLNEAEQLGVQVLGMRKKLLGVEHPDTLSTMANLACTYCDQGNLDEAEQLGVQVLDMRKKLLGVEHPDTIRSVGNLATTYGYQGKWDEAEQLNIQVLDMRKRLLGAEHPDTIGSMRNLAKIYHFQGKLNEAEQLEVQILDMKRKLLGEEHPDTLLTMANLACTYCDQGKLIESEQLGVQVLDMRKKILGAEHPDTLLTMANLATTYGYQRKLNEAELLGVQVLDMRKELLGVEHPDTIRSMGNLAMIYRFQGKLYEAEQLGVQVLDMRKKLHGTEHPDTLLTMTNLACTYSDQGKFKEAEQLGIQVLDMRKMLLGPEHPDTIRSAGNLATTYCHQKKFIEAEQLEVQILNMRIALLGAQHPDTIRSMGNLAKIYCFQGKLNDSEQLEVQVLDIRKKQLGAEHVDTIRSMGNLAKIYCFQGKLNESEQLEVQVLDMRKKLLGAEHPDTLSTMANLACTYCDQGKLYEAEQLGIQVLDTRKELLGAEHPDTIRSVGNLEKIYRFQRKFNEAEQLEVQVLDMKKKLHSEEHPDTIGSMGNLAYTYHFQEKLNEAEQLEVQVLDMKKKLFCEEQSDTLISM